MTTTARIASTAEPDDAYTFSVAAGVTVRFAQIGMISSDGPIVVEKSDSSSNYTPLTFRGDDGRQYALEMDSAVSTVTITGPLDGRINKPATALAVEVVEYS